MDTKLFCVLFVFVCSCQHKPPKASNSPWARRPINSEETAARLQFCAQLGLEPASAPVVLAPASMSVPGENVPSYTMVVYFSKGSALWKPTQEQLEEFQGHLKGASRVEIRSQTDTPNEEKMVLSRALAAKEFIVSQGVEASLVWLNLVGFVSQEEENRRVEIEVFQGGL